MPLPVRLTDAELKARGEELARVMDEIDVSQLNVDAAKAQHRVVACAALLGWIWRTR